MHGCTSPFGSNKEKICNDFDNATKVNDMYKKWYSNQIQAKSGCNKPCSYITLRTNTVWVRKKKFKTTDKTKVKVVIYFVYLEPDPQHLCDMNPASLEMHNY